MSQPESTEWYLIWAVPYGLLVWSTGLSPNPFIDSLTGVSKDEKTHSSVPSLARKYVLITQPSRQPTPPSP